MEDIENKNDSSIGFIDEYEWDIEEENDPLNKRPYIDTLKKIIASNNIKGNSSLNIGLFGEWGCGKSSILDAVGEEMKKENPEVEFIKYDAWKYAGNSFRRTFLLEMAKKIGKNSIFNESFYCSVEECRENFRKNISLYNIFKFSFILGAILWLIKDFNNSVEFCALLLTFLIFLFDEIRNIFFTKTTAIAEPIFSEEQFEDCFDRIIDKIGKVRKKEKFVIIIDNIDRKDEQIEILNDIKTFLGEKKKIIFIIPVDEKRLYEKNTHEFFRKIFNIEIRIKPLEYADMYELISKLNKKYGLNLKPETMGIIADEYATNPRQIIQFSNNLITELNILLNNGLGNLAAECQEIVCKLLIIAEKWSDFYSLLIVKPDLFLANGLPEDIKNINDAANLNNFLRRTFSIHYRGKSAETALTEKLISNCKHFNTIPNEIKNAIVNCDISRLKYEDIEKQKYIIKMFIIHEMNRKIKAGILSGAANLFYSLLYIDYIFRRTYSLDSIKEIQKSFLSDPDNKEIKRIIRNNTEDILQSLFSRDDAVVLLSKYLLTLKSKYLINSTIDFLVSRPENSEIIRHIVSEFNDFRVNIGDNNREKISRYLAHPKASTYL